MKIPAVIIDVFFSVLLVFVVLAQSANPAARATTENQLPDVDLTAAEGGQAARDDLPSVNITLKTERDRESIYVENVKVELSDLDEHVDESSRVLIRPDRNGKTETLMRLLATLTTLNVTQIGFAVEDAN